MKIYFAGSISGAKTGTDLYLDIIEEIKKYGEVLTEHVGKVREDQEANIAKTAEGVFTADKTMLDQADMIIADITAASLGVGREISYCENVRKIPVYCIYNKTLIEKASRMITGNSYNKVYQYDSLETIKDKILPTIFTK